MWDRPTWEAAAKWRSVAPEASERVAGVPSLTVHAGGGLGEDAPAYPVVERPSAASATSFALSKTHLAPRPPRGSHRAATAGERGA